ncbi:MAG: VWA domain-containing protein [Chloroflexi bacterium]|nr:VWA domain-containing protein [Chloroflexota bacterium]
MTARHPSPRLSLLAVSCLLALQSLALPAGVGVAAPAPTAPTAPPSVEATTPSGAEADWAVCVAVDGSGSNFVGTGAYPPSDPGPVFLRAEALAHVAALLPADRPGAQPELAAVFFGSRTVETPWMPVAAPEGRAEWLAQARNFARLNLGWTRLADGVARCLALLEQLPPQRRRLLLVYSDFVAEDEEIGFTFEAQRQVLREALLPRLQRAGVTVSAIGYGQAVHDPGGQFHALMQELAGPSAGLAVVVEADSRSLLSASARVLAHLARAEFQAGSAQPGDAVPLRERITVPPRTAELVLVAEHPQDPAPQLRLRGGDGRAWGPEVAPEAWSGSTTFHQVRVTAPAPGTWEFEVQGRGLLRIHRWLRGLPAPTPTPPAAAAATPSSTASGSATAGGTSTANATPHAAALAGFAGPLSTDAAAANSQPAPPLEATAVAQAEPDHGRESQPLTAELLWAGLSACAFLGGAGLLGRSRSRRKRATQPPPPLPGRLLLTTPEGKVSTHELASYTEVVLGSQEGCEVRLEHPAIAERHLRLALARDEDGQPTARAIPLDGLVVWNGEPLAASGAVLVDGASLLLGQLGNGLDPVQGSVSLFYANVAP